MKLPITQRHIKYADDSMIVSLLEGDELLHGPVESFLLLNVSETTDMIISFRKTPSPVLTSIKAAISASTPVCVPHATPPARQSRCLVVTSVALPTISNCTRSWTGHQTIPRLNPLHPPLVCQRTVSLETPAVHHHNHQRTLIMQRREHYRYHQVWRKPFYGTSSEREEYRKELREQLKRQIEEKRIAPRLQLASNVKEAEYLREVDRHVLSREREERIRHSRAMTLYRDENKKLMEQSWRDSALTRSLEALKERELLHLNPINWSGTLK